MARMTDIDELLEKVAKIQASGGSMEKRVGEIILAITNAPTVEVVRCKDCYFWHRHTEVNREYGDCFNYGTTKRENGFCDKAMPFNKDICDRCFSGSYRSCDGCSYGERRKNEG